MEDKKLVFTGKAHVFGHNIPGDGGILPLLRDFGDIVPEELAKMCMVSIDPEFPGKVEKGDFIVTGRNFPSGWFHEQAAIAMKALGLSGVISDSMSDLFARLLIDYGLIGLSVDGVHDKVVTGDLLVYDSVSYTHLRAHET